jgi:non-specific serine/threonine protein kinase
VAAFVGTQSLLLVLDNCEHLREAAAALVGHLVERCPLVRVLATSRHRLDVPDEQLLTVPPLPVPPPGRDPRSPEALLPYDAVRLFQQRATAVWQDFAITPENQADVAELVRRLDGVPLAIELAAVRVRSLAVGQVLDRLGDRFTLLSRGDRTALPRQQSLRALLDWSHDLLRPAEQQLWERAAVFVGGFDLADLAAVVTDEALTADGLPELADGLVAASVLVREETPLGPRFRQLQSIQDYGLDRLDPDDLERLRDRHVAHYRAEAETAAREMFGPSGVGWFRRLRAEHDDFRAALGRCAVDGGSVEDGAAVTTALLHYWVMTGRFAEGRHWAGRLLALPTPVAHRVPLLVVAGRLAVVQGDLAEGRALLEQALEETTPGNATWRAHALHGLALAALFWEEPAAARSLLEEALTLHRDGEDPFGVPLALIQLATLHAALGDTAQAAAYAEECLALSRQAEEAWCAAMARWTLALAAWGEGRTAAVRSHAREVLRLKEPFGDRLGMAMCLEVLAWSADADGRHEEAARLLGAVAAALDSVGGALFRTLQAGHDECVASTREALGEAPFDRLVGEGTGLPFEDAVALALGRSASGARLSTAPGTATAASVRLTRRESEVARLVADGLSDREIAERLVLARRTAEGHVQGALRKLGFTSRQQLAGWVSEHRVGA